MERHNNVTGQDTGCTDSLLSVVIPAYNEEAVLPEFHRRLMDVLNGLQMRSEIIYVDDGSTDNTVELLKGLQTDTPSVSVVVLSRNFGKEIALTAGLDHTSGDAVVVIDADLQDPPELIPELIEAWQAGYDVAYAKRMRRDGESIFKKASAYLFYRVIQKMTRINMPEDAGDFRLLSRRAVDALAQLRERHRFMKGLFAWIGYPQKAILYRRDPRYAGHTSWNYWKLWNFALDGVTSFTVAPLKVAMYLGLVISFTAFIYGGYIIFRTLVYGSPVPGYPSIMVTVLFLGGIQLSAIGIIGEYLGRMFDETKARPLYLVMEYTPASGGEKLRQKEVPRSKLGSV